MIAPMQAENRRTNHPSQTHTGQSDITPKSNQESTETSSFTLIGDSPIIAVVSAVTLGVLVGWLLKRKLGQ